MENTKTWLVINAHNMAFRYFYDIPQMTTTYGWDVNAIYEWVRSQWKLENMVHPDAVCAFFDSGASNTRKNILSTYKVNRKVMPGWDKLFFAKTVLHRRRIGDILRTEKPTISMVTNYRFVNGTLLLQSVSKLLLSEISILQKALRTPVRRPYIRPSLTTTHRSTAPPLVLSSLMPRLTK
jgi:hypothetical protein